MIVRAFFIGGGGPEPKWVKVGGVEIVTFPPKAGISFDEITRKMGITPAAFYRWKKKFAGMGSFAEFVRKFLILLFLFRDLAVFAAISSYLFQIYPYRIHTHNSYYQ